MYKTFTYNLSTLRVNVPCRYNIIYSTCSIHLISQSKPVEYIVAMEIGLPLY